eukprot:748824-Pleurochrysis_carterae.AAC.2
MSPPTLERERLRRPSRSARVRASAFGRARSGERGVLHARVTARRAPLPQESRRQAQAARRRRRRQRPQAPQSSARARRSA